MDSTSNRTYFNVRSRPHHFVGGQLPLSDNSPYLADDPITSVLFDKRHRAEQLQEQEKRQLVISRKIERKRELSRRICERETVENYIQTPYLVSKGVDMEFGINVFDERIAHLRKSFTKAEKFGAVEAVGKLEQAMRQSCLRVQDLFALVDHDRSGTVDRDELQKALRAMKVDLDDTHFSALFRYLDSGGNGEIDAKELEDAVREHRRFLHSRQMIESYEKKLNTKNRKKVDRQDHVKMADERISPSYQRLYASPGSSSSDMPVNSIPMAGQKLITSKLRSQLVGYGGGEEQINRPMTIWEMQATKAIKDAEANQSREEAYRFKNRDSRREELLRKLHQKQEGRVNLELATWGKGPI